MSTPSTPLERARAKRDGLERKLIRYPDFHLYLIAKAEPDRARMKRGMMEIPSFRLWCELTNTVEYLDAFSRSAPKDGNRTPARRIFFLEPNHAWGVRANRNRRMP
jgi:hypothetical protein